MTAFSETLAASPFLSGSIILLFAGLYLAIKSCYNVYFHPLRKYPGPKLFAASHIPWGYWYQKGLWHEKIRQLHDRYGHIVRIAPDELSFDVPEAWEEIYGRGNSEIENTRPEWFAPSGHDFITAANKSDHKRMKAVLAPGFSHAALTGQEPTIKKHMDHFIHQLRQTTRSGQPVNMVRWVNYLTFDIIGDLLFGKGFDCVTADEEMRAWQDVIIANLQLVHIMAMCKRIWIFWLAIPPRSLWTLITKFSFFDRVIEGRIKSREASESPKRIDILELMRKGKNASHMTRKEISATSNLLALAGSESSANATASLLYRIASDSTLKERLLQELRENFRNEDEIGCAKTMALPYLSAVIEEGLRLHPVTPNALWRETPKGGNKVFGDWVPGNTILSIHHRAMYLGEHNFKRAKDFVPERWLPDSDAYTEFADDRRDAFRPFSYGARMCPARNLGYAEMSIIITRLLWAFEITVAEESSHWPDGLQAWVLWDKRPLWLCLKPRVDNKSGV